jgi:hypothetical protein
MVGYSALMERAEDATYTEIGLLRQEGKIHSEVEM